MQSRFILHLPICYCIVVLLLLLIVVQVYAQTLDVWDPPQMIMKTEGVVSTSTSALVSDDRGNLHLFFNHITGERSLTSIDYTYWNGTEWSQPTDIIVDSVVHFPHAVLDSSGIVHLIWLGPLHELKYASAPISQSESVRSWTAPQVLGTALGESCIALGADETLYVAYPDYETKSAVMLVKSVDGGETWTPPTLVASVSPQNVAPDGVQIVVDGAGRLHVTWTEWELPDGTRSIGTFYTRSMDGGDSWALPKQMAVGHYGQIGVGTLGRNEVHVVWRSGVGGDGTFHRWSPDGGVTWHEPSRYADRGGFSGLPSFVEDAAGRLHYVLGAVKYASWDGQELSAYQDVAPEIRNIQTRSVERGIIGITSGNRLHIVFELDFQSLWHTSMLLDAPSLPTATPEIEVNDAVFENVKPTTTRTQVPVPDQESVFVSSTSLESQTLTSFWNFFAVSIVPVFVIIVFVVLISQFKSRS